MKKTFFRILPFVAAVVLAASCGKDGDSDVNINDPEPVVTPDPTQTTVGDGFVEIPFSIKVNDGNTLSKVALDGTTKSINFEESDVWNDDEKTGVQLTVTGDGVSGTLNLVNVGGYKFDGKLSVEEGKQGAFSTGDGIDLVGTFTQNKGKGELPYSATSFEDLWNDCAHTYKAEFSSTDKNLELVDQNVYFYVATYKSTISINDKAVTSENGFTRGSYYAYPYAANLVTGIAADKTIAPSKLYTIGKAVTGVTIDNPPTTKVWGNDAFTLTAIVAPENATNKNVTWSCTTGNATINDDGEILITGTGEVTIVATTEDGNFTASCNITVPTAYVDLGTSVYWYTSNYSNSISRSSALAAATNEGALVPTVSDFQELSTLYNSTTNYFVNPNGSGAQIKLYQSADDPSANLWTSTSRGTGCEYVYCYKTSFSWIEDYRMQGKSIPVRFVCAKQ